MTTEIPATHPLRPALWIWPGGNTYLLNHFAQFRKDFTLTKVPAKAPLFITADKSYRLYVNGHYVCRGPARGYQNHWPFDEVDIREHLVAGENWLAIEAYNPGVSTFAYIHQTCARMICAARWGSFELYSDDSWAMRRAPGRRIDSAKLSLQLDFQEHIDLRLSDRSWITANALPADWSKTTPYFGTGMEFHPFGRPPYDSVEPRGIPLFHEEERPLNQIVAHATGACGAGWQTWQNVSWGWVAEGQQVKGWSDFSAVAAKPKGEWLEVTLSPAGDGNYRAVTIDAGEYTVGHLLVEAVGAVGGEVVDFQYDEALFEGRPALTLPGSACGVALANRLTLAAGANAHEFYHLLGFRYVTVIGRGLATPLTLRLKARRSGYPFTMKGTFTSADPWLNDLHAACRRTQQACALDAYMDTPWREQAQWWGDARVQAKNTFHLDGDARLLERGIRSIAGQFAPHGLTYGHAPTCAYNCILPDFSLTWLITLWDHYWQTGDAALTAELWPRAEAVLSYFEAPEARHSSGLLRHDTRFWLFEDWSSLYKGEVPTFLNLWYLFALRKLAEVTQAAGLAKESRKLIGKAKAHEKLVLATLYHQPTQLFREGLDEACTNASVHDQVLALILNLVPQAHPVMLRDRILPYLKDEPFEGARPSAFWSAYVLEETAARGYVDESLAFIRKHWAPMVASGMTWEGFEWTPSNFGTQSHAWTSHPCYHLVNTLGGIRQVAPAWSEITYEPYLPADLPSVAVTVPTRHGLIRSEWTQAKGKADLRLSLPKGVTAKVRLPDGTSETLAGGKGRWRCAVGG
ncbi:MAG: alpha-L-rhamnosidase C-terminal domain-containing protein [Verrucomicrobiota bacterium]|nr:alpha-L-rhamnosidase C-terminal domain-containing protein [Verrucomicrobiota bacterium]